MVFLPIDDGYVNSDLIRWVRILDEKMCVCSKTDGCDPRFNCLAATGKNKATIADWLKKNSVNNTDDS